MVRSRTMARSNSAKDPSICIIIRPAGVVVSIASVSDRNPAPAAYLLEDEKHVLERARLAVEFPDNHDVAFVELAKEPMEFGRSQRPPDARSSAIRLQPTAMWARSCRPGS